MVWITGSRDEFVSKKSFPFFIDRCVSMGAFAFEFDLGHNELQTVFAQGTDVPSSLEQFIKWLNEWIDHYLSQARTAPPPSRDIIYSC